MREIAINMLSTFGHLMEMGLLHSPRSGGICTLLEGLTLQCEKLD